MFVVICGHNKCMTKTQATKAIATRAILRSENVPNFVTPSEAVMICTNHGVAVSRFAAMVNKNENPTPIAILDVAMEIVKKGGR